MALGDSEDSHVLIVKIGRYQVIEADNARQLK